MTNVRDRVNCLVLAVLFTLVGLVSNCDADCFYSCSNDNPPEDWIQYQYDGRDYVPVNPGSPPVRVYGPPVYYRNGYPIPVDQYPPDNYHHGHRRSRLSDEALREHERAVQEFNRRRW